LGQAKEDRAENPQQVYAPSAMRPLHATVGSAGQRKPHKQNTRYKLRLFGLDDEDKTAPTANEAALVEESGCDEIGDKKIEIVY
jgi:hypothetical protein